MKLKKKRKIKALIFDMFGVLVVKKKEYYKDKLVEQVDGILGDVVNDDEFKAEAMETYDLDHFNFNRVFDQIANKYEFSDDLWYLLPKLKKKYKIAVLTNGSRYNSNLIFKDFNTANLFDEFISSSDLGFKKPDVRIFKIAAKKLGLNPSECVFIDDSIDNIRGAEKLGMKTLHWEASNKKCTHFLANNLLKDSQ